MTEPSTEVVLEEIQKVAEAELGYAKRVRLTDKLADDLRLDSLASIVVAVALEDRFRIRLREQDAGELVTVADIVELVQLRCREDGVHARRA